jgi:Na+:H+ antiporter, NhaA family
MPFLPTRPLLARGSWPEVSRVGDILRTESVGGALLLVAAAVALAWANSPWRQTYHDVSGIRVGPSAWHLDLSLGDLRDLRRAALPVVAAVGGMIAPALVYVAVVTAARAGDGLVGWAMPVATDIAFALAVLAVISTHLPAALRTFLLTLAVVDDLLGIVVIGVFYTDGLRLLPLALAVVPLAVFTLGLGLRWRGRWLLLVPAVATWVLVHESGVHATVAGVLLGFAVPVRRTDDGSGSALAQRIERLWRPLSAGVAVPVFAFFAAGVTVVGTGPVADHLTEPVTIAVATALVVGKTVGVLGATWVTQRFTRARLSPDLAWWDVLGLAILAGMGFTVSLLIGELAFGTGSIGNDHAKVGILLGSLVAALTAGVFLRIRNRRYKDIQLAEDLDLDADGVPDVFGTVKPPL